MCCLRADGAEPKPCAAIVRRRKHTIRTQSPGGLYWTVVTGLGRGTQWDDMADLKATVAHDDALDHKLQDGLLAGKGRLVQARVDATAERCQVHPHGFGSQPLLA